MKALTDLAYWEERWWSTQRPQRLRWLYRDQDYEICQWIRKAASGNARILEVGGGGSRILPYLGWKLGNPVFGADFSFVACRLLRENLKLQGIEGGVVCEDLFQSSLARESFDVVYSCGLVEHFEDQRGIAAAHVQLLKPGGRLLLTVPNLQGAQGKIFRRFAPQLWSRHIALSPDDLSAVLQNLGLRDVRSGYLGSFVFRVLRDPGWTGVAAWPGWVRSLAFWGTRLSNAAASLLARLSPWRPHTRTFSPYVFATGVKPQR
jgi:SAM-dependent methyltransferase